jgi:hypothetical protein
MSKQKDFGAIYARTLSLCPQYQQSDLWQAIPVPTDVRRPPEDPAAVVADLQEKYPNATLLESGVATMGPDGDVQLDPALCDASTAIIALRKKPQQDPFDLVTNRGGIATGAMPLCACLRDGQITKMFRSNNRVLCAACSSADAVALLSLGIPTTLASGLAQVSGDYLEDICRCYKLGKSAIGRGEIIYHDDEVSVRQVVVVGWSPATLTLDEPEGLSEIVSHLTGIERHLEICLDRFSLWQLTPKELEGIVFRMEHLGHSSVRAALWGSLMSCRRKLVPPWTQNDVPKDLAAAIQGLHKSLSSPGRTGEDEKRAWQRALQLFRSQATAPWFEQLEDVDDAAERSLMIMGAMGSQMSQIQALQILMKMTCIEGQKGATRPGVPSDEQFQQYVKSSDLVIKAVNALTKYRKNS